MEEKKIIVSGEIVFWAFPLILWHFFILLQMSFHIGREKYDFASTYSTFFPMINWRLSRRTKATACATICHACHDQQLTFDWFLLAKTATNTEVTSISA